VFSFGLAGDQRRQSMYPARLFTLPVTTGALAEVADALARQRRSCGWRRGFPCGRPPWTPGDLAGAAGASLLAWTQA
jgi:hypothetical protein